MKKKGKPAQIAFVRDETVPRDDVYKSHTVHVPTGEPATSRSRPVPKPKPGVVRPITQGKLLKKGGPSVSLGAGLSWSASHRHSKEPRSGKSEANRPGAARQVCSGSGSEAVRRRCTGRCSLSGRTRSARTSSTA
jgi:myosin-1